MDITTDHRACLEEILALTAQAIALCDRCGDNLTAAKLEDARHVAQTQLRKLAAG